MSMDDAIIDNFSIFKIIDKAIEESLEESNQTEDIEEVDAVTKSPDLVKVKFFPKYWR